MTSPDPDKTRRRGFAAMALTVLIWAGFSLTARATQSSSLAFTDVAMIRAAMPALVFLPWLPSRVGAIRRAGAARCLLMAVGGGAPFFWLAVMGGGLTSAAHVAAVIAGTVPLFVAAWGFVLTGKLPTGAAKNGLSIITVGVLVMIIALGDVGISGWGGVGLLLFASLCWSTYTSTVRQSGLDPIAGALLMALPSTIGLALAIALGFLSWNVGSYTLSEAMPFLLVQGLGVGVVASLSYTYAITTLGPEQSSAIGSTAPALAALLAIPLLGETLSILTAFGVVLICCGVWLSSRH